MALTKVLSNLYMVYENQASKRGVQLGGATKDLGRGVTSGCFSSWYNLTGWDRAVLFPDMKKRGSTDYSPSIADWKEWTPWGFQVEIPSTWIMASSDAKASSRGSCPE